MLEYQTFMTNNFGLSQIYGYLYENLFRSGCSEGVSKENGSPLLRIGIESCYDEPDSRFDY